jgi:hypothetical protein
MAVFYPLPYTAACGCRQHKQNFRKINLYILKIKNMANIFHRIKAIHIPNLLTEVSGDFYAKVISESKDICTSAVERGNAPAGKINVELFFRENLVERIPQCNIRQNINRLYCDSFDLYDFCDVCCPHRPACTTIQSCQS